MSFNSKTTCNKSQLTSAFWLKIWIPRCLLCWLTEKNHALGLAATLLGNPIRLLKTRMVWEAKLKFRPPGKLPNRFFVKKMVLSAPMLSESSEDLMNKNLNEYWIIVNHWLSYVSQAGFLSIHGLFVGTVSNHGLRWWVVVVRCPPPWGAHRPCVTAPCVVWSGRRSRRCAPTAPRAVEGSGNRRRKLTGISGWEEPGRLGFPIFPDGGELGLL